MLTVDQLLTSNGRYPDRKNSPECTDELKANAKKLLDKVNALLKDLGITKVDISSGFRTAAVNAGIGNAAKKSLHMQCRALDIVDDSAQTLAKLILSKPELLKKYDLWIEDPKSTKGKSTNWVHLDIGIRPDRSIRSFSP